MILRALKEDRLQTEGHDRSLAVDNGRFTLGDVTVAFLKTLHMAGDDGIRPIDLAAGLGTSTARGLGGMMGRINRDLRSHDYDTTRVYHVKTDSQGQKMWHEGPATSGILDRLKGVRE